MCCCGNISLFKSSPILQVAGLPKPQACHAVIMAEFAYDCVAATAKVFNSLSEELGPDTADLQLRVGLHSGAVTGGVVRGHKSRFQLFGNAMNMTYHLESTGVRGRIHASLETAKELARKGKSELVYTREDKIVLEGKGDIETFWILPRNIAKLCSAPRESEGTFIASKNKDSSCQMLRNDMVS